MLWLLAMGTCVLLAWVFARVLRPEKIFLRRVPGRRNDLSVLHLLGLYLAYFFAQVLAQTALASALGIQPGQAPGRADLLLPAAILAQVVLLAGGLVVASMTFRLGLRRGLGLSLRHWPWDLARAVLALLAVLPACVAALKLTEMLMPPQWIRQHAILRLVPGLDPVWLGPLLLCTVVLAPLAEELFFRGLVQSYLRRILGGAWAGVLGTSAMFALAHWQQVQAVPAMFVLAVFLGYNYERTGRLTAPILIHALFNAVMVLEELAG